MGGKDSLTLPFYESHPPAWLPKIHSSGDLGYPGFHPPRPRQDEDVLTTANVKDGVQYKLPISVEYFSYNKMINEKFMNVPETMSTLEGIMNEIFMRRADRIPQIPPSTFRIPARVTLNDAKRQAWFADLANPDVPLHKLGKSVPHGAKGHDLLDLLHSNNVAISRAVWFLRVFGANETAGLRNKPNYVPTQYSVDMAVLVTTYLRKQIAEIALPSAPRAGLNIKQTFKGVLADAESRERWLSRFSYCLQLLRTFYAEDLVDHRTFLTWLIHQMLTCHLAQVCFLIRLADEYLEDILTSRALSRLLAEACLAKLLEIRTSYAIDILKDTEMLLKIILQRLCLVLPDSLVSPKMWNTYVDFLEGVLLENLIKANGEHIEKNSRELKHALFENFLDVKRRNEAMVFKGLTAESSVQLVTAVSSVKLLNSISTDTTISAVTYFDQAAKALDDFKVKLDILLTWSVTPLQYGDHRPFAAATLIETWRNQACDRACRRDMGTPSEFLQDQLFDWLDTSDVAGEPSNIGNVALLYGKLVRHHVFSYSGYIQRLIARAEPGLAFTDEGGSRHRLFLTWIPLYNVGPALINQRKVILYGARARGTPEELVEREIRSEIRAVIPELFETTAQNTWGSTSSLLDSCKVLTRATRFEQVRTFRQWFVPHFKSCLTRRRIEYSILFKAFLISVELMASTKCFHSLLDLMICMLEQCTDVDSMNGLIGVFYRFATIWTCMDVMPTIVKALDDAHYAWKLRGVPSRPLLTLLMKFDNGRYLSESSRERLAADISAFTMALQPDVHTPVIVPDSLPEIRQLIQEVDPNAASNLADGLWMKYRTSSDWGFKVWDNIITSLRQVPSVIEDVDGRQACALRYASFLWKVDQHLQDGLDGDILRWFNGSGKTEIINLAETWDVLVAVLLYLAVNGGLKITTVLEGLVYPAWSMGGIDTLPEHYLAAANSLCFDLLLREDASGRVLPPRDLFEVQSLRTRRQEVYEEPHFSVLIASIPALISLEINPEVPEHLRVESTSLRFRLCQDPGFRQGAYRDLNVIRDAFDNSPFLMDQATYSDDLCKREIAGLKMILYDSIDDTNPYEWPEVESLLSPWKIAATTIQMQLHVKQLGRALSQDSTAEVASTNLNKLSSILFHHTNTADEAYYVAEMVKGADVSVASKFINNGLQCMSEILSECTAESITLECLRRVGELLRVLVQVSEPLRDTPNSIPTIDPLVQEKFLQAILNRFNLMQKCSLDEETCSKWRDSLVLPRLIQFILSFKCNWSQESKEISKELSGVIFDILLRSAGEDNLNLNLYPILLDTLLVILDELPHDPKLNFDPHRHYPRVLLNDIPTDIPPEYRKQLSTLLQDLPSHSIVTDLVNSHRDAFGNTVFEQPVVNKPWEWIENLGEPPSSSDPAEEEREREERIRDRVAHLVKNTSSISLEYFAARHTGDTVKVDMESESYAKLEGFTRGFEDGLSESVFTRDWRETRFEMERELSPDMLARLKRELDPNVLVVDTGGKEPSSVRSVPQHQSPTQSKASNVTIIDVDNIPDTASTSKSQQTGKRKASSAISDDEIEIIEGATLSMTSAKRQKANKAPPAVKTRTRKK